MTAGPYLLAATFFAQSERDEMRKKYFAADAFTQELTCKSPVKILSSRDERILIGKHFRRRNTSTSTQVRGRKFIFYL